MTYYQKYTVLLIVFLMASCSNILQTKKKCNSCLKNGTSFDHKYRDRNQVPSKRRTKQGGKAFDSDDSATKITGEAQYNIVEHTLENGLKLLILEKHDLPVVAVQAWYRTGNSYERRGASGAAHFVEHLVCAGFDLCNDELNNTWIKGVEVEYKSFCRTSDYATVYTYDIGSDHLELALQWQAGKLSGYKFDEDSFDREWKGFVSQEASYNDFAISPSHFILREVKEGLYPNPPHRWSPVKRMEDIKKLTIGATQEFYDRYYAPNNVVLVVVGDVYTGNVVSLVEAYFGCFPPKKIPPEPDLTHYAMQKRAKIVGTINSSSPITTIAFPIPKSNHPDTYALRVLANAMAHRKSSRLWKLLVDEKKLAHWIRQRFFSNRGPGILYFPIEHLPGLAEKVETAFINELDRVKAEGFSHQELTAAKDRIIAHWMFNRYSVSELAEGIGWAEVIEGDYRLFNQDIDAIEKISNSDLIRVSRKHLTRKKMLVVESNPQKDKSGDL